MRPARGALLLLIDVLAHPVDHLLEPAGNDRPGDWAEGVRDISIPAPRPCRWGCGKGFSSVPSTPVSIAAG